MGRFETVAEEIAALVPSLRRFAFALTRNRTTADDLVQDSIVQALDNWQQQRPDRSFRAWLMSILHNRFISDGRQSARRGATMTLEDLPNEPSSQPAVGPRAELRDVMAGLGQLSADHRAVLMLIAVESLSYEEAAATLGIPVGTVMSRLARARESLRLYMETGSTVALRRIK